MAPVLRCGDVVEGKEGRWEVERKIGEGQFSEVYHVVDRARQEHVSERQLPPPPPLSTAAGGGALLCKLKLQAVAVLRWAASLQCHGLPVEACFRIVSLLPAHTALVLPPQPLRLAHAPVRPSLMLASLPDWECPLRSAPSRLRGGQRCGP